MKKFRLKNVVSISDSSGHLSETIGCLIENIVVRRIALKIIRSDVPNGILALVINDLHEKLKRKKKKKKKLKLKENIESSIIPYLSFLVCDKVSNTVSVNVIDTINNVGFEHNDATIWELINNDFKKKASKKK